MNLRKAWAFVRRDFAEATSYRLSFLLQIAGIALSILSYYFLSLLLGNSVNPYLEPYGGNYFAFVLIGIAFSSYVSVAQGSFAGTISRAQATGTLEALLVTQTGIPTIVISSSLYDFIWTTVRVLLYLAIGVLFLGVDVSRANLLGALLVLLLTIVCFSSIGILSASSVVVFKRGDLVGWLYGSVSSLLGGVFYPITVLPDWLQRLSALLPITYSLRAMRQALLSGASLQALAPDLGVLLLFSVVLLPVSVLAFNYAVRRAKMDGSLTHF